MSVGLGIIGYAGVASRLHLPVLSRLAGVRVTAIAGRRQGPLATVADRYGIRMRYHDFGDLLRDPTVDAVAICVQPELHGVIGLAALEAKKHVFIEKPLALSLEECDRLVLAAKTSAVTTMVGFHLRWHRLVQQAHEWMAAGRLGTVELLRTVFTSNIRRRMNVPTWKTRRQTGGGVLIESGVHYYDLWRFLTGSEIDDIQVMHSSDGQDDTTATMTAHLHNGILASASFCQGTADSLEIDIYGSAGRLRISGYALDGIGFTPSGKKGIEKLLSNVRSVPARVLHATRAIPLGGYYANAYRNQWSGFFEAIRSGKPAGANFADGREATRIAIAATQSANQRRVIRIADCADVIAPAEENREGGRETD